MANQLSRKPQTKQWSVLDLSEQLENLDLREERKGKEQLQLSLLLHDKLLSTFGFNALHRTVAGSQKLRELRSRGVTDPKLVPANPFKGMSQYSKVKEKWLKRLAGEGRLFYDSKLSVGKEEVVAQVSAITRLWERLEVNKEKEEARPGDAVLRCRFSYLQ